MDFVLNMDDPGGGHLCGDSAAIAGLDRFLPDCPVLRARLHRLIPSGKGVNVSVSLADLGLASLATGFVGENDLTFYRHALVARSIRCRLIPLPVRTRMNTTILWDRPHPGELHLREQGDPLPPSALATLKKNLKLLARPRTTFVFSGSAPPGVSLDAWTRLLTVARFAGSTVCVDSSGPGLHAALKAGVNLIKPNDDELAELTGMPAHSLPDALAAAESLLHRIDTILVSRGARGALLVRRDGAWAASVRLPKGRSVNSVGAGDAFLAGWLLAQTRRLSPRDSLASAVAAGAANALEPTAGVVNPKWYRGLLKSVSVKTL